MIVVLTGQVGAGKSTVCRRLTQLVADSGRTVGGVLTEKDVRGNLTVMDLKTGDSACLAKRIEESGSIKVGGYFFCPDGIRFGQRAIENSASADLLLVDEIGPLEAAGSGFSNVFGILAGVAIKNAVVVIREAMLPVFKGRLGVHEMVLVNADNRDALPGILEQRLFRA